MLAEHEAWRYIARCIKLSPRFDSSIKLDEDERCHGLCTAIKYLRQRSNRNCAISKRTLQSMNCKIRELPGWQRDTYVWLHTPKGREQRRKFCLKQAKKVADK